MDYFDRDHAEYAEARRRERIARQERQARVRRKRLRAFALITTAFTLSYVGGLIAHASRRPPTAPVLRVAAAPALVRVPSQAVASATAAAGEARAAEQAAAEAAAAESEQPRPEPKATPELPSSGVAENVRIAIGEQGFEPNTVRVKAGLPVTITVAQGQGCAAGFLMPDLGITKDNSSGPVTFRLGPLKPGTYRFTCGMEMVGGELIVS